LEAGFLPACVTTCVGNALHLVDDFDPEDSGKNVPKELDFANPLLTVPSVKFATG
jgi:Fe-S-cluster-containing dehydrogenase component